MKLNKTRKINSKRLFELQLIKAKAYSKTNSTLFKKPETDLSNILLDFKKSVNIIFKYHKNNKRILFIGSPKILENQINSNTIHTSIPSFLSIRNKFIADSYISKNIKFNKYFFNNQNFFLSKLKKKPELVVIFNHIKKESIIQQTHIAKIPVIEFNFNRYRKDWNYNYNIHGNIELNKNKLIDNVLFVILNSLFSNKHS